MFYKLVEAFSALLFLLPIFLLLNQFRFHDIRKTIWYILFAIYLAAVYHLVGLPTVLFMTFDVNLNLIPFDEFRKELVLSLLNIALFVPLGFFLPLLWKKYRRIGKTLVFGFGTSLTIELLQLLTYRATDVNDLVTNTLGTLLGFGLFQLAKPLICKVEPESRTGDMWLIIGITAAVMFFLQPPVASLIYDLT